MTMLLDLDPRSSPRRATPNTAAGNAELFEIVLRALLCQWQCFCIRKDYIVGSGLLKRLIRYSRLTLRLELFLVAFVAASALPLDVGCMIATALLPLLSALPLPTSSQLQWQMHQSSCFVHYNMATMVGTQGCQSGVAAPPPLAAWQPVALDTDAWMDTCKAMGGVRMIYVAKHGCGFAAWRSNVTAYNYSVSNVMGAAAIDVVDAFVSSAKKAGLGIGFYYSDATNSYCNVAHGVVQPGGGKPGQLNVTQEIYDEFVVAHLTELWSAYGALDEIWFDGGYHTTLKQRLADLLTKLQPKAVVFGGSGLTKNALRWVGTESGLAPYPVWSTTGSGSGSSGSANGTVWMPAEADFTLQRFDQWFYARHAGVHSPKELRRMYETSAGSNTGLIIDIAPFPNGSVPSAQRAAATTLGKFVRGCYGQPPLASASGSSSTITVKPSSAATIDRVMIREDQSKGERVRSFSLTAALADGSRAPLCTARGGKSVGNMFICVLHKSMRVTSITLEITEAADVPHISQLALFSCSALAEEIDGEWTDRR